jgi:predicted methyltransferase
MRILSALLASLLLLGCTDNKPSATTETPAPEQSDGSAMTTQPSLSDVLAAQPEQTQARYVHRHPAQTLEFFSIEPGMTVMEALPGGGWYSKILLPYLGDEGALIGANYTTSMRRLFGFYTEEQLQQGETWTTDWPAKAATWTQEANTPVSGFIFGSLPQNMTESADAVMFIRALHNLARFEDQGGFLTAALNDAYNILKPGGVVGVVQHAIAETAPDDWAKGNRGYLKQSFVIAQMEQAGFIFEEASAINANPKDQPQDGDVVWRLPPVLSGSKDNPDQAAMMQTIGESNRMTLRFRKPSAS